MATQVPQSASGFALEAVRTGRPVVAAGLARMAQEIAFLNGHNLHKCGEVYCPNRPAGRTALEGLAMSAHVPYSRTPGAQVARVVVELHPSNELGDSQTIAVTLPTGAAWLDDGGLDGSTVHYNPPRGRVAPRELIAWCDVSGVTAGTLTHAFTFTTTPSAKGSGIKRATVTEAPLAALAIDADEPGWDEAATTSPRPVIDGGASSPRGMQRLFRCIREARKGYRQHFLLSGLESADTTAYGTTPHWSRESATDGALDWVRTAGATDPCWYLVTRALYDTATAGAWYARVRYRTSNATACELTIIAEGGAITSGAWVGSGSPITNTITLTATSGAWAWLNQAAQLPSDGTDGLVRITITAKGPGATHLLSIAAVALIEDEL